jgi:hypothetical protein
MATRASTDRSTGQTLSATTHWDGTQQGVVSHETADPTVNMVEGSMFVRTDLDEVRIRTGSGVVNEVFGGYGAWQTGTYLNADSPVRHSLGTFGWSLNDGTYNYRLRRGPGRTVSFTLRWTVGAADLCNGANTLWMRIPVTMISGTPDDAWSVRGSLYDVSGGSYYKLQGLPSGSADHVGVWCVSASGSYAAYTPVASSIPVAIAAGDVLVLTGTVESST